MSRTVRQKPYIKSCLRKPKSKNEKSKLSEILSDPEMKEYPVAKMNRVQSRAGHSGNLPTAWDDIFPTSHRAWRHQK